MKTRFTLLFALFLGITSFLGSPMSSIKVDLLTYLIHIVGLGTPNFSSYSLTTLCIQMMPLFIIQILFGMQLYHRFCTGSAYFFSRQKNRVVWYIKDCSFLLFLIFLFLLIYLSSIFILSTIFYDGILPAKWIFLFLYIWCLFSLYTFIFSILINACAVLIGHHTTFILFCCTQIFLVSSMTIYEDSIPQSGILLWLFKWNPISNIIITWHTSEMLFPQLLNQLPIDFRLNDSILYLILLSILSAIFAGIILCKIDISLENKEEMS